MTQSVDNTHEKIPTLTEMAKIISFNLCINFRELLISPSCECTENVNHFLQACVSQGSDALLY